MKYYIRYQSKGASDKSVWGYVTKPSLDSPLEDWVVYSGTQPPKHLILATFSSMGDAMRQTREADTTFFRDAHYIDELVPFSDRPEARLV